MKYHIELSGEDVLLILRWLETTGQNTLAVRVRDQYYQQQSAFFAELSEKAKQKETAPEKKTKQGFEEFFRGLFK